MDSGMALNFTTLISEILKEAKGTFFLDIEDKSAIGGVMVKETAYNIDKIYRLINKWKNANKIILNHLMVGSNIILIQFEVIGEQDGI